MAKRTKKNPDLNTVPPRIRVSVRLRPSTVRYFAVQAKSQDLRLGTAIAARLDSLAS